ncbi:hypothetical protein BLNAU_4301 [Blattamonas nauphoetae]|uniref:Uncharacterized protein n=1 Tax=Blattamonas nauphoetae TaxID=2049346 RepID=A0ABQ9YA76_9EUKA|nr:hypothetical protein BLNAU_4301 [Blattamonas nauphoetae]
MALYSLHTQSESDLATRSFLQTHKIPSASTDSSSELVPFAGRLCGTLAVHASQIKTLFTESSYDDPTISALSTTLPEESPRLTGNALLEVLSEEFALIDSLSIYWNLTFRNILIDHNGDSLLKSTIITCLDLLEHENTESNSPPTDRADLMLNILDSSWNCFVNCIWPGSTSLLPVIESVFSDVPQLCSLLERTCRHSSQTDRAHIHMIVHISFKFPRLRRLILEENLIHRVIDTSKPMTIPTIHGKFHKGLIWAILSLIWDPTEITKDEEELKRIRILQFERVLKPAKQYLEFILQREESIPIVPRPSIALSTIIAGLLRDTLTLERNLFEDGVIVETGREEWEVGWLMEKTNEQNLGDKLKKIREDDEKMKTNEKARWKKRVERQREAGHEDALEGWLLRRDNEPQSEIVQYVRNEGKERGMNGRL